MSVLTGKLNQTAVYWATPSTDGYGGFTFDAPVEISVRWVDKAEKFVDPKGEEDLSQSVIVSGQDLDIGGYLFLGELTDLNSDQEPQNQSGAYRIKQYAKTPGVIGADVFVRRIWL